MIKLFRPNKPVKLAAVEKDLTKKFIDSNKTKSVWKQDYIIAPLLDMTNSKCAYSEQMLGRESAYMEVDHFKPKDLYPYDVVNWDNLLPSCKKCNTKKGALDVVVSPIVDPSNDNPKDFFFVKSFYIHPKKPDSTVESIGKTSIVKLDLNGEHFQAARHEKATTICDFIYSKLSRIESSSDIKTCIREIKKIKDYLVKCGSKHSYSAVCSTHILFEAKCLGSNNLLYKTLKSLLHKNNLWDTEFQEIEEDLLFCSLPRAEQLNNLCKYI